MFITKSVHQAINNWSLLFSCRSKNTLNYYTLYFFLGFEYKLSLLQNVGTIHQSMFTKPMNSLLSNQSSFTKTNVFTQNLMKSRGIQGHFLLQCIQFNTTHFHNINKITHKCVIGLRKLDKRMDLLQQKHDASQPHHHFNVTKILEVNFC